MILMYHKVYPSSPTIWWVTVDNFYRQMSQLSNKKVVYLDDFDSTNPDHVVITFDGVYQNVLEYACPILKHFNYPFELFVTSEYVGKYNDFDVVEPRAKFADSEELKKMVSLGGRLQWHSRSHLNLRKITNNEVLEFELNVPETLRVLDKNGFNWFAYPHGEFNNDVISKVKKYFKGALSCNQGNNVDEFQINRVTVFNKSNFRKYKIACIIPCYNYGDFLIEAIESVLKQTILPDEILISDDCSDDNSYDIAKVYQKKYPNLIKINRNLSNLGIIDHFNKAVSLINSEYIIFLGADNRLMSNYIEECSKILDTHPNVGIAYTDFTLFGRRAKLTYDNFNDKFKGRVVDNNYFEINFPVFNDHDECISEIKKNNFIHGSSMFKLSAFKIVGGYRSSLKAEDYNFFQSILEAGFFAKKAVNTKLEYRQHSGDQANNLVSIYNKLKFYEDLFKSRNKFELSLFYRIPFFLFKKKEIFLKKILNYKLKLYKKINL